MPPSPRGPRTIYGPQPQTGGQDLDGLGQLDGGLSYGLEAQGQGMRILSNHTCDLPEQIGVVVAGFGEERVAMFRLQLQSRVVKLLDALPALWFHGKRPQTILRHSTFNVAISPGRSVMNWNSQRRA
jgi:hypothetical protein